MTRAFCGAFFGRITQQIADALHHGQQGGGAGCLPQAPESPRTIFTKKHAPDNPAYGRSLEAGQNAQSDAAVKANELHDRCHHKGKQAQPDNVVGESGKDGSHGRLAVVPGQSLGDQQHGGNGNTSHACGHGLVDPHDAGPYHNAENGHAVVRQPVKSGESQSTAEKRNPCQGKTRESAQGIFCPYYEYFHKDSPKRPPCGAMKPESYTYPTIKECQYARGH